MAETPIQYQLSTIKDEVAKSEELEKWNNEDDGGSSSAGSELSVPIIKETVSTCSRRNDVPKNSFKDSASSTHTNQQSSKKIFIPTASYNNDTVSELGNSILVGKIAAPPQSIESLELPDDPAELRAILYENEALRQELSRIMPRSNDLLTMCNILNIDPAICTVPGLLQILVQSRTTISNLESDVTIRTQQLLETAEKCKNMNMVIMELKRKIIKFGEEEETRIKWNVQKIYHYFEDSLAKLRQDLVQRNIEFDQSLINFPDEFKIESPLVDFTLNADDHTYAQLRRKVSCSGTDKWNSHEELIHTTSSENQKCSNPKCCAIL